MNRIVAEGDASAEGATAIKKAAKKVKPNERMMQNVIKDVFAVLFLLLSAV